MKFKKMGVAWSVGCGVVAVLLIGLWVRSYGHHRQFNVPGGISGVSDGGSVWLAKFDTGNLDPRNPYTESGIPATWSVHMPYWSLTLLTGLLAIAPWLPWHFSLRTLLVATTLFALALGTIVWLAHR